MKARGGHDAVAITAVYVANAADNSISIYRFDRVRGRLELAGTAAAHGPVMPLAVSPDRRHLYASIRAQPYAAATYRIDPRDGALAPTAIAPLPASMTHIATDRTGRFLFGASYGADVVSVNPVDADGVARGEALLVLATDRHPHAILPAPSNRHVYVTCLGADRVLKFDFDRDTGRLAPSGVPFVALAPATGPRHFAFAPDNGFVYVLGELAGTVTSCELDPATGDLTPIDTVASVPAHLGLVHGIARAPGPAAAHADDTPRIWASDIHVRPDGRFLYIAERTSSRIATIACDRDSGKLAFIADVAVEAQPRGFAIDPDGDWLIVAGERAAEIGVYAIDRERGTLARTSSVPAGRGANWVEIVELESKATP